MLGHLLAGTVEESYGVDALEVALANAARVADEQRGRRPADRGLGSCLEYLPPQE